MNPVMIIWAMVIIICGVIFILIDFSTRGFLSTYLSAKLSRGKKVFIIVNCLNDKYFKTGKVIEKNFVHFKDQNKKPQKVTIPEDYEFESFLGFKSFTYSESDNSLVKKNGDKIVVYDPQKTEDLFVRAQQAPEVRSTTAALKKNLLPLISVIVGIIALYLIYQMYTRQGLIWENIELIKTSIETIQTKGVIQ